VMNSRRLIRLNRIRCPSRVPKHHIGLVRMESVGCCSARFRLGQRPVGVTSTHKPQRGLRPLPPDWSESGRKFNLQMHRRQQQFSLMRARASGRSTLQFEGDHAFRGPQKMPEWVPFVKPLPMPCITGLSRLRCRQSLRFR
jgi:hypothetical protein